MPKVSVYLPDALADDARRHGISLSPVCQQAVQSEVLRRSAQAQVTLDDSDLEAVVERLRSTRREADLKAYNQGLRIGETWAKNTATYAELRALAEHAEEGWVRLNIGDICPSLAVDIWWEADPTRETSAEAFEVIRSSHAGGRGVVDGALAVFRQVEPFL